MTDSCGTCRFFREKTWGDRAWGICQRFPPPQSKLLGVDDAQPHVHATAMWCGEFLFRRNVGNSHIDRPPIEDPPDAPTLPRVASWKDWI